MSHDVSRFMIDTALSFTLKGHLGFRPETHYSGFEYNDLFVFMLLNKGPFGSAESTSVFSSPCFSVGIYRSVILFSCVRPSARPSVRILFVPLGFAFSDFGAFLCSFTDPSNVFCSCLSVRIPSFLVCLCVCLVVLSTGKSSPANRALGKW